MNLPLNAYISTLTMALYSFCNLVKAALLAAIAGMCLEAESQDQSGKILTVFIGPLDTVRDLNLTKLSRTAKVAGQAWHAGSRSQALFEMRGSKSCNTLREITKFT